MEDADVKLNKTLLMSILVKARSITASAGCGMVPGTASDGYPVIIIISQDIYLYLVVHMSLIF